MYRTWICDSNGLDETPHKGDFPVNKDYKPDGIALPVACPGKVVFHLGKETETIFDCDCDCHFEDAFEPSIHVNAADIK